MNVPFKEFSEWISDIVREKQEPGLQFGERESSNIRLTSGVRGPERLQRPAGPVPGRTNPGGRMESSPAGRAPGRMQACHTCGQGGHYASGCPRRGSRCSLCHSKEHTAMQCHSHSEEPTDIQGHDGQEMRSLRTSSRQTKRVAKDLPEHQPQHKRKPEGRFSGSLRTCHECGGYDHLVRDCAIRIQKNNSRNQRVVDEMDCYECGRFGHLARDCKIRQERQQDGNQRSGSSDMVCYECGDMGHLARNCERMDPWTTRVFERTKEDELVTSSTDERGEDCSPGHQISSQAVPTVPIPGGLSIRAGRQSAQIRVM